MSRKYSILRRRKTTEKYAVVISRGKAHDAGHTSTVFCLQLERNKFAKKQVHVKGSPFRLHDINGLYIWKNDRLRDEGIRDGSIVSFFPDGRYRGNTGKMMEISEVLTQLQYFNKNANTAVVYRGIKEAFPHAVVAPSGDNQRGINQCWRPGPPYALISVVFWYTVDDRLHAVTRLGESINLNNRSRGEHKQSNIEEVKLPVQQPSSENDVNDVILVAFGNRITFQSKYEAVCEGILESSSHPTEDITECMSPVTKIPVIPRYPITKKPRGYCLIINNMCFERETEEDRYGAQFDEDALSNLFSKDLHFDVHVRNDLLYFEIQQVLEEFAKKDHSDCDVFFCIIMSHGSEKDLILGRKGRSIGIETLMSEYTATNCPTLADKPKVFIIQACRGLSEDPFMRSSADQGLGTDSSVAKFAHDSTLCRSTTPRESDFLLAFSTVPGYISYRNAESGSLFIQTLVEDIRQYHTTAHFADILTVVTNHVVEKGSQVPQPTSTLRANLYL